MRFTFTLKEARNLIVSTLILGFLFSLDNLYNFVPYTVIVGIAFITHELSHKLVAEHFDCKAEYVLWPKGIIFAVFLALISRGTIVFAALGFVTISTYYATRLGFRFVNLTQEESGKISIAGPIANILLGVISALFISVDPLMAYSASLNFMLAIFNLLPFPPLDGSKVLIWSRMTWVSIMAATGITWILTFTINPIIAGIIGLVTMIAMLFWTFMKEL